MKLLHFRRFGVLCFASSLALASGCFSVGDDDDDGDDDSCETDEDCSATRFCDDGECRRRSGATGGSGGSSGASGSGGSGNTPGKGGTGGSTGGSSATGGTGGSSGGSPPRGGTGGTGSGATGGSGAAAGTGGTAGTGGLPASCTTNDPIGCASSDEMILCAEGVPRVYSCSESCPLIGFSAVACVEGSGCCGEPTDSTCADGAAVFCFCSELCTGDVTVTGMYIDCFTEEDPAVTEGLTCMADYLDGTTADCDGAIAECGAGGSPPAPEEP
jgi:hypothetical protein